MAKASERASQEPSRQELLRKANEDVSLESILQQYAIHRSTADTDTGYIDNELDLEEDDEFGDVMVEVVDGGDE